MKYELEHKGEIKQSEEKRMKSLHTPSNQLILTKEGESLHVSSNQMSMIRGAELTTNAEEGKSEAVST